MKTRNVVRIKRPGPPREEQARAEPTIFVDLDGTLVRTDLFVEAIFALLRRNPLNIFRLLASLARPRARGCQGHGRQIGWPERGLAAL